VGLTTEYCKDLLLFDVMQTCAYHGKCASVVEEKLEEGLERRK